jgi:hypothetical protein
MSKQAKQKMIEYYEKELEKMLSDKDFERYLGDNCIIKYSELDNYATINDLLPNDKSFKVILILLQNKKTQKTR